MFPVEIYVQVRRACMVEGMSVREASRVFALHRDTVRKMLTYSVPPVTGERARPIAPPAPHTPFPCRNAPFRWIRAKAQEQCHCSGNGC